MDNQPRNIGELIALAIISVFCLGLSWMIAIGCDNISQAMKEQRQSSTHIKGVQVLIVGPQVGA